MRGNVQRFWYLLMVGCLVFGDVQAQVRQLGTWKSYLPYQASVAVCDAGDKVFSASSKSLFSYDKSTGEIRTYDKATGLSDMAIKTMNYDPSSEVLAVAYTNSNIDLIFHETDIYNIADIKAQNSSGAVGINDISFYNGKCYISSDIGISVIDLNKKEIENTYVIGSSGQPVKVMSTDVDGSKIYAATSEGLKYANFSASNLQDFNSWAVFDTGSGMPIKPVKYVSAYDGHVYTVVNGNGTDTLLEYNGNVWSKIFSATDNVITSLREVNHTLYFTIWNNDNTFAGKQGKIDLTGTFTVANTQGHVRPIGWFESNGISWEGDYWNGLFKNNQGSIEKIIPDGPFSASVFQININGNTVSVAPGGVDDSWTNNSNRDGFFQFKEATWTNRNQYSDPVLTDILDLVCVSSVPSKGKTYFGSFWGGLVEYDEAYGTINVYDKNNSILEGAIGDDQRTRISAMTSDADGNLWVSNAGASRPIKILKNNGQWVDYSIPYFNILMKKMLIDRNGQLWAPLRTPSGSNGILVLNNNGTLDDVSDDKVKIVGAGVGSGGLPDATVYSIAEDKDGNIWAGTLQGIGVFYCAGSELTNYGCDANQIKVERDGYVGYLFGTESVRAIAVDAANRKWIGTTNGLWLISADGKTELLKFTADNSPLPSNQITDIAVDDQTGEVFIGTTGGLVSYQGDAQGECADCKEALVYPNPVKPDYDGPIAIKGLVEGAYVKITDISGNLIFQGRAKGSQMIWNGKNYNGVRAKSGIYLVFSSTDLGKGKKVAKILLTN